MIKKRGNRGSTKRSPRFQNSSGSGPKWKRSSIPSGFLPAAIGKISGFLFIKKVWFIGERLHEMGLGLDDSPVVPFDGRKKMRSLSARASPWKKILLTRFFEKNLLNFRRGCRRMRKEGFYGRRIALTVRYSIFYLLKQKDPIQ